MRRHIFFLSLLLLALALPASASGHSLKKESEAHQIFLLRDALSRQRGSDFYAGEVACAFNQTTTCEERLRKVLAAAPRPAEAEQIHRTLAAVALREGRYSDALREVDSLLALDPDDADAKGSRPLLEVLSRFPDEEVQVSGEGKARVALEEDKLPVLINGKKASYYFDSGANLSVLSESEAVRLGMQIQEVKAGMDSRDINGNQVSFRIAVARSLTLGDIQLSNVAFLVAANQQPPFADMKPGERGLIGLPVLLAMGSIRWTRDGVFEADRSPLPPNLPAANLCFDDLDLVTQAGFEGHELPFVLDTGAATSDLWPKFAQAARDLIRQSGTRESHTVEGMGGTQKFEVTSVPKVVLRLGGEPVTLQPAHILETQQRPASRWFYGNLGVDLLRQAHSVTIDFRTMTLKLSPGD